MSSAPSPYLELLYHIDTHNLSRNKQFSFFTKRSNYRALRVYRYLESLAQEIVTQSDAEDAAIEHMETAHGLVKLTISFPALKSTHAAYLTHEEYAFLCRRKEVRRCLRAQGIPVA